MNIADIYDPRLKPGRRLLMQQIATRSGGLFNRRAERLQIRALEREWPAAKTEQLLGRLLVRAVAAEDTLLKEAFDRRQWSRSRNSLARVKGWGSAGQCPVRHDKKTPATKARDCRVAAAALQGGDDSSWVTSQQAVGGGVV